MKIRGVTRLLKLKRACLLNTPIRGKGSVDGRADVGCRHSIFGGKRVFDELVATIS